MNVERFVDEIAAGVHREVVGLKALREIREKAEESLEPADRNPNRGDLMRLSRIAAEALKEIELPAGNGLYRCPTCGENVTRYGQRCPTCERALAEDRLERESGR